MAERPKKIIEPQKGYQSKCLSSPADIVIGGGAAGVGKTFALLMEFLRHIDNPNWGGVIFRRTSPQIKNEGGLWDVSMNLYPFAGGEPKESFLSWKFPKGAKLKFSHLEYEKNILDWQGAQIPFIGFDELTHFNKKMFFYLLSRNRSTSGIKPYVRATCNPDPDSWVADFISWWIDQDTGFPIPERDGVIRYFTVNSDEYIWGDSKAEVIEKAWFFLERLVGDSGISPDDFVKSVTFISGSIYDNKELLKVDPAYLGNLNAQDEQTKAQLLEGNWKFVSNDMDIYDYSSFLGVFENPYSTISKEKYITADIALKGSNKFVVGGWAGLELVDIDVIDKSDGGQVITTIKNMQNRLKVPNTNVCYDNDGVGGFIDGFIKQSKPFVNNSKAMNEENYEHLKAQCYYKSGDKVKLGEYKVSEYVANKMYDVNQTVRQRMLYERKAIRRDKADMDGKLRIIPKDQMKVLLNGDSPDLMDMFMMREFFELKPKVYVY